MPAPLFCGDTEPRPLHTSGASFFWKLVRDARSRALPDLLGWGQAVWAPPVTP